MATKNELLLVPESLADVMTQADKASYMMSAVRGALLAPENRKAAPHFNTTELAALCDADRSQIVYRSSKGDLPGGTINSGGNRRTFTLVEAMPWIREFRAGKLRPEGAHAVCISVANFKGGVGKTTTAMTLAQGLSLKGHKVLVLDCDPQGSLTTLFGILPDTEVDESQTILPVCLGQESSITPSIQNTYWSGLDLVCAAPLLFAAEFGLPARQMRETDFEFWNVLNQALDDVRDLYDVIIIDTPPALSYVTINALTPISPGKDTDGNSDCYWTNLLSSYLSFKGNTRNLFTANIVPSKSVYFCPSQIPQSQQQGTGTPCSCPSYGLNGYLAGGGVTPGVGSGKSAKLSVISGIRKPVTFFADTEYNGQPDKGYRTLTSSYFTARHTGSFNIGWSDGHLSNTSTAWALANATSGQDVLGYTVVGVKYWQ